MPQRQALTEIDGATIPVLEIGVHHDKGRSTSFQEALVVDTISFQMYAQSGIARDPEEFELVVNDQIAPFDRNGKVTVNFIDTLRIAAGQSASFQVGVRLRDPELISSDNGNFRLRVLSADVRNELSRLTVPAQVVGSGQSSVIAFQPKSLLRNKIRPPKGMSFSSCSDSPTDVKPSKKKKNVRS